MTLEYTAPPAAATQISVIIPALNEEAGIASIVERVLAQYPALCQVGVPSLEVIVVDDGSHDQTAAVVERLAAAALGAATVRLVRHGVNRGYGAALKTGLAQAQGDLIAFLDADGTYPPEYFPQLCASALGGADVVIGSRMSGAASEMPVMRRVGNVMFAGLITLLGDQRVRDSASGMRVIRRAVLPQLYPLPNGLNFTPIMSMRAIHEGLTLVEIPIPYRERVGRSKLSVVRDGLRYTQSILWTALGYNPVRILGTLGLAGVGFAGLVGVALVVMRLQGITTVGPWGVAAIFAALVLGVGGVSLFGLGATFNYLVALLRKRPVRMGLFGKPIFDPPLDRHFGWMGLTVGGLGVILAGVALLLGVRGWELERLSLYLVGSSLLMLVGLQLGMSWILMRALEELSEREIQAQHDLSGGKPLASEGEEWQVVMSEADTGVSSELRNNLGTRRIVKLPPPRFPDADAIVRSGSIARSRTGKVDVLLVNPPSPDGGIWIRTQHRVGRRSRENMIWPQVSLAQMAALLAPDYSVEIVDAIATRMTWDEFAAIVRDRRPQYYLTQVTAPTLTNDMYGAFLAKSHDAVTIAFGTHVTPLARETLRQFPALDFVLRGEPEMTLRELIDTFAVARGQWHVNEQGRLISKETGHEARGHETIWPMWTGADPTWRPAWTVPAAVNGNGASHKFNFTENGLPLLPALPAEDLRPWPHDMQLVNIKGLGWRRGGEIMLNWDRPFFASLDDLPIPHHHLLPLDKYRMPMIKGPYTFIVTSRGCPAGCKYCIKHVSYQNSVRLRSPEKLVQEMWLLHDLGVHHIHMYADLFTVNRDQVVELCKLIIKENLKITFTANSRVDYVDEELLRLMGRAGCTLISWGIESGNEMILKKAHKGYKMEQAHKALTWAKRAGIKNWGYFIIGLPGETVETIAETMAISKKLPLDIALFHVAAPYPGTPFFFEVVENNWFRSGTNWEEVDMDQGTVLDYENLKAEDLLYWQKRAFREWAFRPGPVLTMLKSMNTWAGFKSAMDIGLQTLGWVKAKRAALGGLRRSPDSFFLCPQRPQP